MRKGSCSRLDGDQRRWIKEMPLELPRTGKVKVVTSRVAISKSAVDDA